MPKVKDVSPISVTRVNKTIKLEIVFNASETISQINALRMRYTQQGGVDVVTPEVIGSISLNPADVSVAITNKLVDLNELIDAADNF